MGTSNKHASKITTGSSMLLLLLYVSAASAGTLPAAGDINSLAEKARLNTDTFIQQSFELRMKYEFSGKFLNPNDKDSLHKLAKEAGDKLQTIAERQKSIKQQIEDYQGRDWDERFGSTGLWRKLAGDIYVTTLSKCEIDFYLAIATEQPQRKEILQRILSETDSLNEAYKQPRPKFIKAKALALLAQTDSAYKAPAIKELEVFAVCSDILRPTQAAIEKIKLLGLTEPNELNTLVRTLAQNHREGHLELILQMMFLQRQHDPVWFEKTVQSFPQTEDFIGSLVLSDLSHRIEQARPTDELWQQTSIFEAELAVQAAWANKAQNYKRLLNYLSSTEKFQTPLILHVTAVAFADSSPIRAVNLLIKAGKLQQLKKSDRLNIEADEIAAQAAQLAYNLFAKDLVSCPVALEAFDNYCAMAGEDTDEEMEYLHSIVLNNCGRPEKARELLQRIADRVAGSYSDKAKLKLAVYSIHQGQYKSPEQRNRLLRQLSSLITDSNDCEYTGEIMQLLAEVTDEIDRIQADEPDWLELMEDCKRLAKICYGCLDKPDKQLAGLFLAEISVFAANKEKSKLSEAEELLSSISQQGRNVDFVRCRARLLAEQNKFASAAALWSEICEIRKNDVPSTNQRSWKWWRAKFYELYCWSKSPQTQKEDVLHTIEVLENSFDIPALWSENLSSLKQHCRNQLINYPS